MGRCTLSPFIVPHHTLSHFIAPHRTLSHLIVLRTPSRLIALHRTYRTLSHLIALHHTPYFIAPYGRMGMYSGLCVCVGGKGRDLPSFSNSALRLYSCSFNSTYTNTAAGVLTIPPSKRPSQDATSTTKATIDWLGAFLITGGLLVLLFALTEGNVVGESTP